MLICTVLDGDVLAIKEHLIDELDYILVPTEGWNKLVSWYGLTEGQEPTARKVCFYQFVYACMFVSHSLYEIHGILLTSQFSIVQS